MAMQVAQGRSFTYVALVVGAASLVAAAFWSATYGRSMTLGGLMLGQASWPLLVGSPGLLACAVVVRVKRRGLPQVLVPAAGDPRGPVGFAGRAECVGSLCRLLEDDGGTVLQLLDNLSTGVALLDHGKQVLRVNLTFCLLFNLKPEAVEGKPLRDILPGSFLALWSPRFLRTGDARGEEVAEVPLLGSGRVLRTTLAKIRSVKRGPELLALLVEDVAGKRSVPADASQDQQMGRHILDGIREAAVLAGPDATILDLNEPAVDLLGYGRGEALGLPLQSLLAPNPDSPSRESEPADIFTGEWKLDGRVVELPLVRRDKRVFPAKLTFGDWGDGSRRRLLISIRDTTAEKQADLLAEDRLRVIEMMSQNRPSEAILTELTRMVEHQMPGSSCAVLLRRGGCLRPVAAPGLSTDLLAHLDGLPVDTWRVSNAPGKAPAGSVLVPEIAGGQFPAGLCAAAADAGYRSCWATPVFSVEGLVTGFVVVFRREVESPTAPERGQLEVASRMAAVCLGQQDAGAVRRGRANRAPQSRRSTRLAAVPGSPDGSAPEQGPVPQLRLDVQAGLKRALDRGEFSLHFQPQFHLATQEMAAVEALLRWKHPQLGLILPSRFIPAAEESGLIVPIGAWVLREACRHVRTLPQNGKEQQRVAVNISGLHFTRPDFLEHVMLAVQESGIPAGMLELELPENLLIENAEDWAERMARLRRLGVRITVEGFGADYSSLSQVPRLPVDSLKIDRCFVEHLAGSKEGPVLVRSMAALAGSLHMEATAPCVETQEQLEILESSGCACVQGYLFGAPLTGDELRQQAATLSLRGTSGMARTSPPRLQPSRRNGAGLTAVA